MSDSPAQHYGLLVIGSGPAGVHAAAAYVEAGGTGPVCLVSQDRDEPYMRPPLSKEVLAGDAEPEVVPILEDTLALALVELRLATTVVGLDLARQLVRTRDDERGEQELGYDRLVLATGADPVPLPGAAEGAPVHLLRTLGDARGVVEALAEARTVVVVGSGFIGCEAAAALAGRGVTTTLVTPETAPQAARLGDWVGEQVTGWLEDAGVVLRTGTSVEQVAADGTVTLDDGSTVAADLVLAAVGVTQQRDFLDGTGLTDDDGRVVVDEELRTSDAHVLAAGDGALARHDLAERPIVVEHWGDAETMGALAGRNAAASGASTPRELGRWDAVPGFWSDIGEHALQYSAWGDGFEEAHVVEHGEGAFTVWYADAAGELVGVLTHDRDEDYERGGELLAQRADLAEALD